MAMRLKSSTTEVVNPPYHGSRPEPESDEGEEGVEAMAAPVHPVHAMQAAFEESIMDSMEEGDARPSSPVTDAQARRQKLLDSSEYDESWTTRWKQRPAARHHPLHKLMAQIAFGMHLLQQQQAKSEEEVVKILQAHVNEIDAFLERTSEDFDLAIRDIEDRIRFLKLPMTHLEVFETMLDDKKFRSQLLDGNEKIEKIIDRTTRAMNAALLDVQKGAQANRELGKYLNSVQYRWPKDKGGISEVFPAMRGNEQGWKKYLRDLQLKANNLSTLLAQLTNVIGEMAKMAAVASRRTKPHSASVSSGSKSAPSSPGLRSKFSHATPPIPAMPSSPSTSTHPGKSLPPELQAATGTSHISNSKAHPVPLADRYEKPRQPPQSPDKTAFKPSPTTSTIPARPRTAGGVSSKEARAADARGKPRELLDFLQKSDPVKSDSVKSNPNPLRSNPPDDFRIMPDDAAKDKKSARSEGQGAKTTLTAVPTQLPAQVPVQVPLQVPVHSHKVVTRSRSHGAMNLLTGSTAQGLELAASASQSKENILRPRMEDRTDSVHSTGFARRLSKRMKHLPRTEEPPLALMKARQQPYTLPPDSAYSSGTDKKSPPNEPNEKRPESLLGPLPFQTQARGSSSGDSDGSSTPRPSGGGIAPSVRSIASTSKSKSTLGIRNIFRGKFGRKKSAAFG